MTVAETFRLAHEDIKPMIGSRVLNSKEELLSGALAGEIRELLEARGVLAFPEIHFTDDEQVAFTKTLGKFAPERAGGEEPVHGVAEDLRGGIVDIGFEDADGGGFDGAGTGADDGAQDVGLHGEVLGACAVVAAAALGLFGL